MTASVTYLYTDTNWEQASEPLTIVQVHESDIWPIHDNSIAGNKDTIGAGKHPVVAIGGRTVALGRPLNITGVVVSFTAGLTVPLGMVRVNIADGYIVRQYVNNILTYNGGNPATYEQAVVPGYPVYVDDSDDLSAGVTLSMSPLNSAGLKNPQAGVLWYCQDEYADSNVGGPNATSPFDTVLPNSATEQVYCVLLFNGSRDLA